MFKPFSISAKSWAPKHCNQELFKGGCRLKTVYAVAAISLEHGLEDFALSGKPIAAGDLAELLTDVLSQRPNQESIVFLDNLRMHYSHQVQQAISSHGSQCLFNAPYSS